MRLFNTSPHRMSLLGCVAVFACGLLSNISQSNAAPEPDPTLPTLFVVGDSTARNNANGAQGWGDPFAAYFDPTKIKVLNRAMAGRSSRSFIAEGRWDNVLKEMKAGDLVLLQMGHSERMLTWFLETGDVVPYATDAR